MKCKWSASLRLMRRKGSRCSASGWTVTLEDGLLRVYKASILVAQREISQALGQEGRSEFVEKFRATLGGQCDYKILVTLTKDEKAEIRNAEKACDIVRDRSRQRKRFFLGKPLNVKGLSKVQDAQEHEDEKTQGREWELQHVSDELLQLAILEA